jgi:hypothetical protein
LSAKESFDKKVPSFGGEHDPAISHSLHQLVPFPQTYPLLIRTAPPSMQISERMLSRPQPTPAPWPVKAEVGGFRGKILRAKTHHVGGVGNLFIPPRPLRFRSVIKRMVEPWRIELQTFALRTRMGGKFFTGFGRVFYSRYSYRPS